MTVNEVIQSLPPEHRRWCGDGVSFFACACMGCANHAFHEAGYTYEDWLEWEKQLPNVDTGEIANDQHP